MANRNDGIPLTFYHRGTRLDRLAERIEFTDTCWIWRGYVDPASGYGLLGSTFAHRAIYEELVDPIPNGLVIDHLREWCGNRACVNPDHLEPVTQLENNRRGNGPADRAHCVNGHEFTPENTYIVKSPDYVRRKCRICQLENMRRQREKRRMAKGGG